jgi:hypothetical protein
MGAVLGLGGIAVSTLAHAAPVDYQYTGGDVVITGVTVDGVQALLNPSPSPTFNLGSSSQAIIDTGGDTLSFALAQSATAFTVALTGTPKTGVNLNGATFTLTNVTADSPSTLALTPQGSGGYTFASASGVAITGTYNLANVTTPKGTYNSGNVNFGPNDQPFTGSATVLTSADTLEIDGLSLGNFTIDGQAVNITGNVIFDGAPVPLPASLWLLAPGLGFLGWRAGRRNTAAG